MAIIEVEHSETLPHPAAAVFAMLSDLESRADWQTDIVTLQVDPAGSARVGSQVHESREIKGHKTAGTLAVTVHEQDKLLVLETVGDSKQATTEGYRVESLSNETCRINCRTTLDGVPGIVRGLVRQTMAKQLPDYVQRLSKLIDSRT